MTFGQMLADACKKQGLRHSELARRLDVRPCRIPEIFRSPNITEALFKRCAKAMGLRVECKLVEK